MGDKYNSSLEDAVKLKFAPFCSSSETLSNEIIFLPKSNFSFLAKTLDYSPWFGLWESEKGSEKRMPSERASQGEQNGTNFSFVAPSSEELRVFKTFDLLC